MATGVCAAPLCSFALKCVTFYMVGLFPELLLCHRLSLNFVLRYLESVGELQLFCLLLSGQGPWGLFIEHCLLAKQELSLWGSMGHQDSVTDFRIKLTWV